MKEIGRETIIEFGKYKGKTGDFIARSNPAYILWIERNIDRIKISSDLHRLAVCVGMLESEWRADQYGSASDWGFSEF
jgi:hypothetical protein